VSRTIDLYRSNRTEVLADALAELLADPIGGPLDPEWVVVQGRGMGVWLSMGLARRHGICAGIDFVYPRNLLARLFQHVLGGDGQRARAYDRDQLTWSVMKVLGACEEDPALAPLARYLEGDVEGRRQLSLASRVADQLDQYVTYRPQMIRDWEEGRDDVAIEHGEAWQPELWRRVVAAIGTQHGANLERELLLALASGPPPPSVPRRVVVFGLSSLPPMYVRVLAALAQHIEVHWFMPSPAAGYWADLVSARRIARTLASRSESATAEALHLHEGQALLASCGALAADALDVMSSELEAMGVGEREPKGDLHRGADGDRMLQRLQGDILAGQPGDHRDCGVDGSIRVHACHGPMREVEVLHDQLLSLLTEPTSRLRPHDVVVMMSDVDTYAPLVEAAFARDRRDRRFLPFAIADRAPRQDSPVIDAFHRVLSLVGGRAKASELLDVLALGPVQRRFGIASEDLDCIRSWLRDSGVRWGIDASHRAAHGQPEVAENTWRFGLERLLLGYAMPTAGQNMFAGVLPFDEIEGQDAELLGRFAAFAERLFAVITELSSPRRPSEWVAGLLALVDDVLGSDPEDAWSTQRIRDAIEAMGRAASAAGFAEPLGIDAIRRLLDTELDDRQPARGFLRGGITFCAMVPMRSVPFAVVALLGMSDGAFPRHQRPSAQDLMSKPGERRAGDRSRRDDDRYLFLEAILAAREQLIITYTGQSIRDNAALPPSVAVSELIDELVRSHGGATGVSDDDAAVEAVLPGLVTRHPLQPFSPRLYDGSNARLFSYDEALCRGAAALASGPRRAAVPLFDAPLPAVDGDVTLGELVSFFENPVGHIIRRRLGVDLRERNAALGDREPVELSGIDRFHLGDTLMSLGLAGVDPEAMEDLARASGLLAPGTPGHVDHEDMLAVVAPLSQRVRALTDGGRCRDLVVEGQLPDGTILSGTVSDRWARGRVRHQFARISGKHVVALWLRHLASCWIGDGQVPPRSYLVGRGAHGAELRTLALGEVEGAGALLADLVKLYRDGQRVPLRLFPKAAYSYVQARRSGKDEGPAWRGAVTQWLQQERAWDPNVARVFAPDPSELDPAQGSDFVELAERVFGPLFDHLVPEGGR
jgi:exodeoxyribonuclease V gamma subunit